MYLRTCISVIFFEINIKTQHTVYQHIACYSKTFFKTIFYYAITLRSDFRALHYQTGKQ
jgi:hypothetical protein